MYAVYIQLASETVKKVYHLDIRSAKYLFGAYLEVKIGASAQDSGTGRASACMQVSSVNCIHQV